MAVAGGLAYVADDSAGLVVIDVSNPAAPVQVGVMDTPGLAYGVAVAGGYAFVADESAGLTVVDVRVSTAPSVVATLAASGNAYGVTISGNHAYLASTGGLHIIDIPAAALAAGLAGAFFETDVDLNNAGATSLTYRLLWLPRGADNSDPVQSQQFSLAAGAGVRYANVPASPASTSRSPSASSSSTPREWRSRPSP